MGLDFGSSLWSSLTMPRGWRLVLLTLAVLTLLLGVPLSQLSDHDADFYYKQIYDKLPKALVHGGGGDDDNTNSNATSTTNSTADSFGTKSICDSFPNMDNITLVMKTGATEAYDKLPTQLLTNMQCMPDFLLFSDLEQQIGNHKIHNVLDKVDSELKEGLNEFKLYEAQITCPVSQKDCTGEMKGAWELDKYKFLHMIERAWEMRPNREWYVFAEADTYVFWPNMIYWLRHKVDTAKNPYVGSVAFLANKAFAHGGSGYVISGETVRKMVQIPDVAAKYDAMAPNECCGDLLMALAVIETGEKVQQAHPMFNGEKPNTLPYGHGHWCEPLLTMHHMNSEEVSSVWQYEQHRMSKGIIQIKDMYEAFFAPNLVDHRLDWDNMSDDTCYVGPDASDQARTGDRERERQKPESEKNAIERRAHLSAAACAKVCQAAGLPLNDTIIDGLHTEADRDALIHSMYNTRAGDEDFHRDRQCFQWRYQRGACCTASSFKLGAPKMEEHQDDRWMSGWFVNGINDWIAAKGDCEPDWKVPS
ncbi:hypothetical protein G7046_g8176 [Stylonectria norvegica]|nr:hypothetical protein G7046_g8176 [Stylonectria norvegica]